MKKWPKYINLSPEQRIKFLTKYHAEGEWSLTQLAKFTGTYTNRLKRDAVKFGVPIDTKSQAMKKALKNGTLKHPTEGKEMPEEVKDKVSESLRQNWKDLSEKELKAISKERKERYKKQKNLPHLSPDKAKNLQLAAKYGSKIELHILKFLSEHWHCTHQAEGMVGQETYHVDILIKSLNLAIEVDGPAHYKKIWSDDKLKKTKNKDARKQSLLNSAGLKLIRVVSDRKYGRAYANELAEKTQEIVQKIADGKYNNRKVIYVKIEN